MTSMTIEEQERALLRTAVARLRASILAIVFGLAAGAGLFTATIWLVIRGGENVGTHLQLLNNYFPGYSVTWGGAFIGLFYGCLTGAAVGWVFAWLYNRIADSRAS